MSEHNLSFVRHKTVIPIIFQRNPYNPSKFLIIFAGDRGYDAFADMDYEAEARLRTFNIYDANFPNREGEVTSFCNGMIGLVSWKI